MTQLRNVGGSPFWSWYGFGSRCCFLLSRSGVLAYTGLKVETNTEYTPQGLEMILGRYAFQCRIDEKAFVHSRGHRKTREQRYYEKLKEYTEKLKEYVKKIRTVSYTHLDVYKRQGVLCFSFSIFTSIPGSGARPSGQPLVLPL